MENRYKMRIKYILAIALLLSIVGCGAGITGGSTVDTNEEVIEIGALLFLSNNDVAFIAEAMQQGIEIAVDELNAQGGINGKKVRIIYEDDQFNNQKAATGASKLVHVNNVVASLSGAVNTAKTTGPIFEEAQIPQVVLWDVNKDLEEIGEYTYGIGFSTEDAGQKVAQLLYNKGAREVAVIRQLDEWSQLISDSFVKEFERLGGEVVVDESVTITTSDFRDVLLKSKNTDAYFAPLISNLELLFKQSKEMGYKGIKSTGDGMTQEIVNLAPSASEGVYFAQTDASGRLFEQLQEKYKAKYGDDSELAVFNALGYDGVMILAQAMEIAGNENPIAIHKALYEIKGFQGASGISTMTPEGSAAKKEALFVVEDGEIVKVN